MRGRAAAMSRDSVWLPDCCITSACSTRSQCASGHVSSRDRAGWRAESSRLSERCGAGDHKYRSWKRRSGSNAELWYVMLASLDAVVLL